MDTTPEAVPHQPARRSFLVGVTATTVALALPAAAGSNDLPASKAEELRGNIQDLCDQMAALREWWHQFEPLISQAIPGATNKIHSSFIDGIISARVVARAAGHQLRDYSDFDWAPSALPANRGSDPFDQGGAA